MGADEVHYTQQGVHAERECSARYGVLDGERRAKVGTKKS